MFVPCPSHLKEPRLYYETVLHLAQMHIQHMKIREEDLFHESQVHVPAAVHSKLSWNLSISPEQLPTRLDLLLERYHHDQARTKQNIDELKSNLNSKYLHRKERLFL